MRFLLFILSVLFQIPSVSQAEAIHDAAKKGDVAGIAAAVEAGADVEEIDKGATPLIIAIRSGHYDAAALLIGLGADVNADPTPLLGPALGTALAKRRSDLITLLLNAGADPNWQGNREAAIHIAVRSGCLDCVKALVEAGADVNTKTKDGKTPLHMAKLMRQSEVADYLGMHGVVVPKPAAISMKLATADIETGRASFGRSCDGCHSVELLGGTKVGPNLWNVVGRDKASLAGFSYSDALLAWDGEWTIEDLNVFLLEPMLTTPGVAMEMPGIPEERERIDLIAYLRTLSDNPTPLP